MQTAFISPTRNNNDLSTTFMSKRSSKKAPCLATTTTAPWLLQGQRGQQAEVPGRAWAPSIKIRTTLRARSRTTSERPQKRANCMGFRAQLNGLCVHYLSASDRIHEKKRSPLFFIILKKTSALFKKTTWCHMHMLRKNVVVYQFSYSKNDLVSHAHAGGKRGHIPVPPMFKKVNIPH